MPAPGASIAAVPTLSGVVPRSSLATSLALLGVTFSFFALAELSLVVVGPVDPAWVVALFPSIAALYVAVGLAAWVRRPENRMGALLVLGGVALVVAGLNNISERLMVGIGSAFATPIVAVVVHLLHAFPSGRLRGRLSLWTVVAAYVVTLVVDAPRYLFAPGDDPLFTLFRIADVPAAYETGRFIARWSNAAVMLVTIGVLVTRVRGAAPGPRRRATIGVYLYGVLAAAMLPFSVTALPPLIGHDPLVIVSIQLGMIAGVPPVFALGTRRGGFARAGGVEELGRADGPATLGPALVAALGDPSAALHLPSADGAAPPAGPGAGRGFVDVVSGGRPTATIDYDADLIADPQPVRSAARLIAVILERDRLAGDLRRNEEELRRSRDRLLTEGDAERRRIARDLHDGLQGKLVLLALRARREARGAPPLPGQRPLPDEIDSAIDELRGLVAGVLPPTLIEHDLAAAVGELADRVPIPITVDSALEGAVLEPVTETTAYFVIAEAVTNAVKHADAGRVDVHVRAAAGTLRIEVVDDGRGGADLAAGSGLRGLADRVNGLGGTLRVDSPAGDGTRIRVELPCAS